MSHKSIGQWLNLRHWRRRNDVVLPVDNFKLIRKFLMRACQLRESIYQRNRCRKSLHRNAVVNVYAGNVIAPQDILQYPLTEDDANNLLFRQFVPTFVINTSTNYN